MFILVLGAVAWLLSGPRTASWSFLLIELSSVLSCSANAQKLAFFGRDVDRARLYPSAALLVSTSSSKTAWWRLPPPRCVQTLKISVSRFLCSWIPARLFQNAPETPQLPHNHPGNFLQVHQTHWWYVFPYFNYLIFRDERERAQRYLTSVWNSSLELYS